MKLPLALAAASFLLLASCATTPTQQRALDLGSAINRAQPFPESAFVGSQGLSVHYRHWRPDAAVFAEPKGQILLMHGFGSSTFSFRFVVPALLEAGWEVAAADVPPFGFSDHEVAKLSKGLNRGELEWAVADALGWNSNVVLLGHSMGGLYAALSAQTHPERTKALILMAGAVPADGKTAAGAPFFAGLLAPFLDGQLHDWKAVKGLLEGFAVKGETIPDEMVDGYTTAFQGPREGDALIAWSSSPGAPPVEPKKLTMPTLLLWGEKDEIVPLDTGKKLKAVLPDSQLVVLPGQGHLLHELHSEAVNPVLLNFLSSLP
ncbi:MAG: alpha/beta hydrolase [Spirochaetales bacterium]